MSLKTHHLRHLMHKILKLVKTVRNFLFSTLNREFLIFLFFLGLSGTFWLLMALNETYDRDIPVPVKLVNVPKNVVITQNVSDTIDVMIRDKGFTLLAYTYANRIQPVTIDFESYANKSTGTGKVSLADLQRLIYLRLYSSSKISAIKSDLLTFYFNYGQSRQFPIRIAGLVEAGKSYYISRIKFQPSKVTVYASKRVLDSIQWVTTETLSLRHIEDTISRDVLLHTIKGAKIMPQKVRMTIYPDILTEESIEVPIVAVNMPTGKMLRTFPSKVKLSFTVGGSSFRNIRPEQFMVVADYNDIANHPSDKCPIKLRQFPDGVLRPKLQMSQVDYLVEQQ
ncbi:conserved hypothetical protein [Segatella oris C735]|uniref:YbbR-like protein n=2 Tax=Segatella oris TaxID=28135 RepID=D7NAN8_9BACT|nr:conserved hypothetical protein [Segatella oris C735]